MRNWLKTLVERWRGIRKREHPAPTSFGDQGFFEKYYSGQPDDFTELYHIVPPSSTDPMAERRAHAEELIKKLQEN